ncbi:MAG: tetratricopeptide repeat protein [Pirellulales bacterium]|nr:tetratricopeptide repeat protein [Pirellulales bacterium]
MKVDRAVKKSRAGESLKEKMTSDRPTDKLRERPEEEPRGDLSLIRRATSWAAAHRLMAGLLGGGCVLILVLVGVWYWLGSGTSAKIANATLTDALDSLDDGVLNEARQIAEVLAKRRNPPAEEAGGPAFVLGVVTYRETMDSWQENKTSGLRQAARYLEDASDRGFPPGREEQGLLLLGRCLYLSDQVSASLPVLRDALRVTKREQTRIEIEKLLAGAYLNDPIPKFKEALKYNGLFLSHKTISDDARNEGLLERANIFLRMDRVGECLDTLKKIPENAGNHAEAIVVRGQVLIHEAAALRRDLKNKDEISSDAYHQAKLKYEAAIECFREAQGSDTLNNVATRRAMYLIGLCYLEMGNFRAAVNQFKRTQTVFPETPEAVACDLRLAELSRHNGRDETALASYRSLLAAIPDPEKFNNPWFTLPEVRARVLDAYHHYFETQNYEISLQLARLSYPLFSRVKATELVADTYRRWGESEIARATNLPPKKARIMLRNGRAHLRQAGMVYSRLAKLRIATEHYADDIWASSDCFIRGQNYDDAVYELTRYLNNESRQRNPRALVNLGKAYLALGKTDKAIEVFQECIDFHPKDVASFQARLWAGRAYREKYATDTEKTKEYADKAKDSFLRIIEGDGITPSSKIWQDALFDLGELFHNQGDYPAAIQHLSEAVRRQPDAPRAVLSRYLIADSYRRGAAAAREKLRKDFLENAIFANTKEVNSLLQSAHNQYVELRDLLDRRNDNMDLYETDNKILRNCYMGVADMLFELENYDSAIEAYMAVISRYQREPVVLQAYLQTARAQQRLNKPGEARRTIKHAQNVLERMKENTQFTQTTNRTRQQWADLFNQLATAWDTAAMRLNHTIVPQTT